MHKQISPASGYGIHLQAWIPKLAITLLKNIKEEVFANILMKKKHEVKWKQTWIAEIELNVLYQSTYKDSDKDI